MLIDCPRLASRLDDPQIVVFDCRHDLGDPDKGARLYAEGHLPGAFFAPVDSALSGTKTGTNGRHPLPRPDDFVRFLERHGIDASTRIVAYDDVGGMYAARLWWLARWVGLNTVSVLDGGLPKWIADGHPLSAVPPRPRPAGRVEARPQADLLADAAEIAASLTEGTLLVVDARAPERFRGDVEPIDPVAGHIPGANNRFYKANLRPDGTLRPAGELRSEFAPWIDARPARNVVHQCGSGITACANLFAMEYAGLSGSRLYAGSWSEWIADPARPVARG
jgi:thiosulfate/3-mercaptopyruvate sulfurtransferase